MEFLDVLKDRKLKRKGVSDRRLKESRIADSIDEMLSSNLTDDIHSMVFEVKPNSVEYVLSVIDKAPLVDKFDIVQIDNVLFNASLKVINI